MKSQKTIAEILFWVTISIIIFWVAGFSWRMFVDKKIVESKNSIYRIEEADLDADLKPEIYTLKDGELAITENQETIWRSPADWQVDDFNLADVNNDGTMDINLSLWKPGNFGSSKPFWIEKNDLSVKNHFFIFDFIDNGLKMVWGSSNFGAPNCEFKIADIDADGKNDLLVIEGNYIEGLNCVGDYVAIWQWDDWGFTNKWRSAKGNFSNLRIEEVDDKKYMVVDSGEGIVFLPGITD